LLRFCEPLTVERLNVRYRWTLDRHAWIAASPKSGTLDIDQCVTQRRKIVACTNTNG
jgi:hypothetical protein